MNRRAIRQYYSAFLRNTTYSLYFLLGRGFAPNVELGIKAEASRYKDIIMGDFEDTYDNLPLKLWCMMNYI